jgi:hypothetical protein
MLIVEMYERKPVHKVAQQENDKGSLKDLSQDLRLGKMAPFWHDKSHRVTHREHKRRKDKVGWGKSMPPGMLQRGVTCIPVPGGVYNDHETYGHAAENVQGQETLGGLVHKQNLLSNVINNEEAGIFFDKLADLPL